MRTRTAGLGLIGLGVLFAVLFVYLPIRDGVDGFTSGVRMKSLVFIPLAVVSGVVFALGGPRALRAFQVGPKSKAQLTLVLSVIIVSGVLSGVGYWQIKSRWLREPEPVILSVPSMPPVMVKSR